MRRCSSDAKLQFISSVPPLPLRYSGILPRTFPLLSFLSTADFIFYGYGSQNIFPVHSLLRNSSSWPSTRQKYFFCKCFFTHSEGLCIRFVIVIQYEKSILYTYDTFTEFSLFQKSCSPGFIFKFSVSGKYIFQFFLPSYFSDWHLINISLPVFPFRSFTVQQLSDFLLSYRTVQFFFTVIHVSGLSCRKSDSYHCLILMDVILLSQWTHPRLSLFFILFM